MSNQADHTIVRLRVPPELKKQIEESAEKNNRSQSAEMVARLERSFNQKYSTSDLSDLTDLILKQEKLIDYMKDLHEQNQELKNELEKNTKAIEENRKSSTSYLDYALSVVQGRVLPDVREIQSKFLTEHPIKDPNKNWIYLNPNIKKAP
jgi:vacuolar-type H+-ATPase catalytic subunit A/Vma1